MAGLYPIGGLYLAYQTVIENGGIFSLILNNIDFSFGTVNTNNIQKVALWTSYFRDFLFNATRQKPTLQNQTYQFNNLTTVSNPNYGLTIMMIIWLVTFLVILTLMIAFTAVQCVRDKRERKSYSSKRSNIELNVISKNYEVHESTVRSLTFVGSRTKRSFWNRTKTRRFITLWAMVCFVVLWAIFLMLLCTTQYLIASKFANNSQSNSSNTSTTSYTSVRDSVSGVFGNLNNFFNIITNQTSVFIESSLRTISATTQTQLLTSITDFGSQVLVTFNVTSLFNTAQALINSINQVVTAMTFINNYCQGILKDIDNTKGSITVYQSNIALYLGNICNSLTDPTLLNTCRILQAKNTFFQVTIQTSAVSSKSSVIMLFILQQYKINITDITISFKKVDSDFQSQLKTLYNNTVNQLNIASFLTIVTTTWKSLISGISPTLTTVSTYNSTAASYMDTVYMYENLAIILLIFLILLMVILVLLLSFRDSFFERSLTRCVSFLTQFIFLLVVFIATIITIAILLAANFSQSEVCNQVNTTSGMSVLDQMVNTKFSAPWNTLIQSMTGSSSGITITLSQPTNLMSGLKDGCRNTSVGLLSVFRMGDIVNISQIVRSPGIMALVEQAKNSSLNSFLIVNPQQIIPSNITSFFAQTSTIITYFDSIDYSGGITELQKPLVSIVDFVGYFYYLSNFTANASKSTASPSDVKYLNDTVQQLITMIPSLTNIQVNVTDLMNNFQTLQTYRNNSFLMTQLMTTITNVQVLFNNSALVTSLFSTIYNSLISINLINVVQQIIGTGISSLTSQMLPCSDLSQIFQTFTTTFCSSSNFIVSMATLGIVLVVEIVLCQIIAIIIITTISLRLNVEENVSKC